jgi:hypothetical protein
LLEEAVDESRLPMVDVGNDGDISDGRAHGRRIPILPGRGKRLIELTSRSLTRWLEMAGRTTGQCLSYSLTAWWLGRGLG